MSTNPVRNKIVPKDPGIENAQDKNKPIIDNIPIGWLLPRNRDKLRDKNIYLDQGQKFTCGILFCSLEILSCSLEILDYDWFDHNML